MRVHNRGLRSRTLKVLFVLLAVLFLAGCQSTLNSTSSTSGTDTRSGNSATTGEMKVSGNKNQGTSRTQAYDEPRVKVIVARDDASLPTGCRPRQVASLIAGFVDGFNQGGREQISSTLRLTGRPGPGGATPWSWYSVTWGGREFVTYDQDELLAYLSKRNKQNERLQLLMASVVGGGRNGMVGADLVLARSADDLKPDPEGTQHLARVKGAIDCGEQKIIRWG